MEVASLVVDAGHADLATTVQRLFTALRRLSPPGLSLTAASTLARLDREGPHRLTELAAKEGVTQPAMTQLVSRLERDGLAARAADPEDGRVVLVEITAAGRELMSRRRQIRADHINEILGTLSEADRRAVDAALPVLNRLADLIPQ